MKFPLADIDADTNQDLGHFGATDLGFEQEAGYLHRTVIDVVGPLDLDIGTAITAESLGYRKGKGLGEEEGMGGGNTTNRGSETKE